MNIKIVVEVEENNAGQMLDHLHSHPFVENVQIAESHTILNPKLIQSIESYESGKVSPSKVSLADLKEMLNA